MFSGLIYVVGLAYNAKDTFEFLQRALLRINEKTSARLHAN